MQHFSHSLDTDISLTNQNNEKPDTVSLIDPLLTNNTVWLFRSCHGIRYLINSVEQPFVIWQLISPWSFVKKKKLLKLYFIENKIY